MVPSLSHHLVAHPLLPAGVYLIDEAGPAAFRHVPKPGARNLQSFVEHIAERIGRALEKQGLIRIGSSKRPAAQPASPNGPHVGTAPLAGRLPKTRQLGR